MKTLKLSIPLLLGVSQAELTNTFGKPALITMPTYRWLQFGFDHIKMLTVGQLMPIYNLLLSYEQSSGELLFKMFHLFDDDTQTPSPVSLQCHKGLWTVVNTSSGAEINKSTNLLKLL